MRCMKKQLTILTGASRGMGLAMAQQCAQEGHDVVCISRQRNDTLTSPPGNLLAQWQIDLSNTFAAGEQLAAWLAGRQPERWAVVNLINNAGVIAQPAPLSEVDPHSLSNALRVGLEAPMLLTAAFLKGTDGWAVQRRVLNISSGLGRRAMASQGGYCAAKAGLDHFTRCLALEEARKPNGAKVCALAPGVIDTDMQIELRSGNDQQFPDRSNFVAMKANGQLTSPQDAAQRILAYLQSPAFGQDAIADIREV